MAININKESNVDTTPGKFKLSGSNWRSKEIPATQGNLVETLNSYNEQIKKHYYDKTEARTDENSLQTSIMNLVKILDTNTLFTNKTITANESSDDVSFLESISTFTKDSELNKGFSESGLVQKINIIANLLSGNTDDAKDWKHDSFGNNVGQDNKAGATPVVGMTRSTDDNTYSASLTTDSSGNRALVISGLSSVEPKSGVSGDETDTSKSVVLSEYQVAQMIKGAVITVLGAYDAQISAILGYLLFTTDTLPESYVAVLKNTKNSHIYNAPLYIKYDSDKDSYYIRDVNGLLNFGEETKDYVFTSSSVSDGIKDSTGYWNIKPENDFSSFRVTGGTVNEQGTYEISYSIPTPKKTITTNFGHADNNTTSIIKSISVLGHDVTASYSTVHYELNGTGYVTLPEGSVVEINLPNADVLVWSNSHFQKTDGCLTFTSDYKKLIDNEKIGCKYCSVKVKLNNGTYNSTTVYTYENNDATVDLSDVAYDGHSFDTTTENGVRIAENQIVYRNVKDNIEDSIKWLNDSLTVTIDYGHDNLSENKEYVYGDTVLLDNPTREGYDFAGWTVE